MITLAEIEAMKKQVQSLLEENTALRLENDKIRTRLAQLEQDTPAKSSKQGKRYIEGIYHDGSIFAMIIMVNVVKTMKNVCFVWKF